MAIGNRIETKSNVTTKIVPAVTNTIHKDLLNNDILASIEFRKDVIDTETESGGLVTVDFSDKDLATVVTTVTLTVSFTGLQNGDDAKYLEVTKTSGLSVSFSGATDVSMRKSAIDTLSVALYWVYQKNGNVYVDCVNINKDLGSLNSKTINIGTWDMTTAPSVAVNFASEGITKDKIRGIDVVIISDTGVYDVLEQFKQFLGVVDIGGGIRSISDTEITLERSVDGKFNVSDYSGTSNRGYVTIRYAD